MAWLGRKLADLPESSGSSGAVVGVLEDFKTEFESACADMVLLKHVLMNQPQYGVVAR